MSLRRLCFILIAWQLATATQLLVAASAPAAHSSAETTNVSTFTAEWLDQSRNRVIPIKIYYPKVLPATPEPVIVFSHGLGGTREHYSYLGEYWAAHGFISVHVQHPGSDDSIWKNQRRPMRALKRAASDPENVINRPLDIRFVIDRLTELAHRTDFPLHDRLDLSRIGVAGHSFGAYTTMAIAGESFPKGGRAMQSLADPRVKAAIAMSTPVKTKIGIPGGDGYGKVAIPVYHLTGTKDAEPYGTSDPQLRRVPFDQSQRADAYLLTFEGGDHMVFSGLRRRGDGSHDEEFHRLIQESTTAFWNAYLNDDRAARTWLTEGGFAAEVGTLGHFEQKHPVLTAR